MCNVMVTFPKAGKSERVANRGALNERGVWMFGTANSWR
ncbi:hypothetical protein AERO9AM_50143 [Aeromicrobium sp. 9AM]|nr:hypothetical protein AERO9AM_50143 [Aeromicrobium sp. 9AM]